MSGDTRFSHSHLRAGLLGSWALTQHWAKGAAGCHPSTWVSRVKRLPLSGPGSHLSMGQEQRHSCLLATKNRVTQGFPINSMNTGCSPAPTPMRSSSFPYYHPGPLEDPGNPPPSQASMESSLDLGRATTPKTEGGGPAMNPAVDSAAPPPPPRLNFEATLEFL
jgi:hypothetical protein